MTGTEKQIEWANQILQPVRELISKFPDNLKTQHEGSLSRIETAKSVITYRAAIEDWCERVENWLETGVFVVDSVMPPQCYEGPSVIRSVIF